MAEAPLEEPQEEEEGLPSEEAALPSEEAAQLLEEDQEVAAHVAEHLHRSNMAKVK